MVVVVVLRQRDLLPTPRHQVLDLIRLIIIGPLVPSFVRPARTSRLIMHNNSNLIRNLNSLKGLAAAIGPSSDYAMRLVCNPVVGFYCRIYL
jgi:hypothetical protein